MSTQEQKSIFDNVVVRLTRSDEEIKAAQRLRYQVFYEEYGAKPTPEMAQTRLDFDEYDAFSDHLVVVDNANNEERIVGTYRLLRQNVVQKYGEFYSSSEYDLNSLTSSDQSLLELGRSCVLPEFRARPVLQLLWQGIAEYITDNKIDLMFGCASLHSTDVASIAQPLSYLYHHHLAPQDLRVRALDERYIDMNIIPKDELEIKAAFKSLPPLIKGYIRVGAVIGDGAVIDEEFNTTDVFIIVQTHLITGKYRKHLERKIQKTIHGSEADENTSPLAQQKA